MGGHRHAPVTVFPGGRFGTHRRGGLVVSWAGLDGRGEEKISGPHQGSNLEPSMVIA